MKKATFFGVFFLCVVRHAKGDLPSWYEEELEKHFGIHVQNMSEPKTDQQLWNDFMTQKVIQ